MDLLGRDEILNFAATAPAEAVEPLACPEMGGAIGVRQMTGTVRNKLESAYAAIQDGKDGSVMDAVIVDLISACVVDADARPILPRSKAAELFKHHPALAFRIRDKAVGMSGLSEQDAAELTESFD